METQHASMPMLSGCIAKCKTRAFYRNWRGNFKINCYEQAEKLQKETKVDISIVAAAMKNIQSTIIKYKTMHDIFLVSYP